MTKCDIHRGRGSRPKSDVTPFKKVLFQQSDWSCFLRCNDITLSICWCSCPCWEYTLCRKYTKYTMDPGMYYLLEADDTILIGTKNSLIRTSRINQSNNWQVWTFQNALPDFSWFSTIMHYKGVNLSDKTTKYSLIRP